MAKCPFFNPARLFSFRDAEKKTNDNKDKQRIGEKNNGKELAQHLPEELGDYSSFFLPSRLPSVVSKTSMSSSTTPVEQGTQYVDIISVIFSSV